MSEAAASSLSVLIVEDNPGDRRLTEVALHDAARDAGMRCSVAGVGSLAAALAEVENRRSAVDAILLDLDLPDALGLEGLRAMRSAAPAVPIIVLTGLSDLKIASEALQNGAGDYLEKGEVQPRLLLRAIRYAIERRKSETELLRLASTDSLTGLLNRRAFFEQLESGLVHARRSELSCAVILFDVDHFKEINDVFGHKTGDRVLCEVARHLREQLRETDYIARIGGDEFAILATNLRSASAAMEIAEKISRVIGSIVELDDMRLDVSISVGISVFPNDDSGADVLLSHADLAMYKSKASRKGSINFFDARMDAIVKARHALKRSMPEDIDAGRFYLLFQPIVDATTRKMIGAEGLARWRDLENKIIAPTEFIPIAEESGSIGSLGTRLIEEACAQIHAWNEMQKALVPISMNISAMQCRDPAFAARLISIMERLEIPPKFINVEMTESTIFKNLDVIQKNLDMLKTYGIGVHIDDFGTGYSSLSLLRDLPLSAVKIDRSFVRDIGKVAGSELIIQAVVDLASKLGFQTIGEGVETEEQVGLLRDMGVNSLQGYYFSKPVPGAQLAGWLAKSEAYLVA
ncbi:MAG TPA: EAL domain-containing protein [Bauldia sp.]|nr:EAL domain-containing protein [Bauldia sp.]